jgi:hypothetical protein
MLSVGPDGDLYFRMGGRHATDTVQISIGRVCLYIGGARMIAEFQPGDPRRCRSVQLPEEKNMSSLPVKPIPEGMHSITPHLVCAGAADAIEFYKRAFGAVECSRMPGPGGKLMHAAIRIGDSTVMLCPMPMRRLTRRWRPVRRSRCRSRTCSGAIATGWSPIPSVISGRSPRISAT